MMRIITAMVTPFNLKEEIDFPAVEQMISFQKKNGINEFWILGTTGEFNMLNEEEKVSLVRKTLEKTKSEDLHVGVSSDSVSNAIRLAKKFIDLGVGSIFSLPPIYHRTELKGLITYFDSLRKTGDRVTLYYNPLATGFNIPLVYIEKLLEEELIDAIKVSTNNFQEFQNFINLRERTKFTLLSGNDSMILEAFLGTDGVVSSVSNFAPELFVEISKKASEGLSTDVLNVINKIKKLSEVTIMKDYPTGVKIAMKYRGLYVGNCRSPLQEDPNAQSVIYFTLKELEL
jgi:4-hydroxy-tetrahydrodipicolinate synthase